MNLRSLLCVATKTFAMVTIYWCSNKAIDFWAMTIKCLSVSRYVGTWLRYKGISRESLNNEKLQYWYPCECKLPWQIIWRWGFWELRRRLIGDASIKRFSITSTFADDDFDDSSFLYNIQYLPTEMASYTAQVIKRLTTFRRNIFVR